jgi:hypothetical protein
MKAPTNISLNSCILKKKHVYVCTLVCVSAHTVVHVLGS